MSEVLDTLLSLVARGNATLAEISRLKDVIPPEYRDGRGDGARVLFDFSYFKSGDVIEAGIEKDKKLQDLDLVIKEEHGPLLKRFYQCFESIQRYSTDLVAVFDDLESGRYIQQSLSSVLQAVSGRQLLVESVYLMGVTLLTVDQLVPGPVRERLLVSYYRYSGQAGHSAHFDTVCSLLRSTGFLGTAKRPAGYPDTLFSRVPINQNVVLQLVGRLRSDDLYNVLPHYPDPGHRSTALSSQASILYILLYFTPSVLHQETAMMREIVDKFFPDNWVISVYLGTVVCLPEAWENYKAAKAAIANTTGSAEVKAVSSRQGDKLRSLLPELSRLLKEGSVSQESLLQSVEKVLVVVRDSNVCLRWLLLHTSPLAASVALHKRSRQLQQQVVDSCGVDEQQLYQLLVDTASLELVVRQLYSRLLAERERNWARIRADCVTRMEEAAEMFGGKQRINRVEPNSKLKKWLKARAGEMGKLDVGEPGPSAKMAVQLVQALEEAKEFHQMESNLQVTQYLTETRDGLLSLVRLASARDDVLVELQIVSDMSYGWHLVHHLTHIMQKQVRSDPGMVAALRATFLKLSSAMECTMVRLGEAGSRDLVSVSQYYSRQLVSYIRRVLQVIPETMFSLLERVVRLQAGLRELPTRLEKDKLKELSQLDQRYEIARLTHDVSVLTSGILAMRSTLVGVVEVDPRTLLEEGVRGELVKRVSEALHTTLTFNNKSKDRAADLVSRIREVGVIMEGFRKSFEYIQDYINIPGLRLWQEEVSRIVNYAVEREAGVFLHSGGDTASQYQSSVAPIPVHRPPPGDASDNYTGRLAREVLAVTAPGHSLYVAGRGSWHAAREPHGEVAGPGLVADIEAAVGVAGLAGLDRLLGLMAVTRLQELETWLADQLGDGGEAGRLMAAAGPLYQEGEVVSSPARTYSQLGGKLGKAWQVLLPAVNELGQITLLRRSISSRLSSSSSFDSKLLHTSLAGLQSSVLATAAGRDTQFPPGGESLLLEELCSYLRWSGLDDPGRQVYCSAPFVPSSLELFLSLFVLSLAPRLVFSVHTGFLVGKKGGDLDGWTVLVGLTTLVQQHHPDLAAGLVDRLGQAVRSLTVAGEERETTNMVIHFVKNLQENGGSITETVSSSLLYNTIVT